MSVFTFAIYALAGWRVSTLIVHEDGPGDCILLFRTFVSGKSRVIKSLLDCVWCVSIWAGGLIVIADILLPGFVFRAALVFALSAVAVIIERGMEVSYKYLRPDDKAAMDH